MSIGYSLFLSMLSSSPINFILTDKESMNLVPNRNVWHASLSTHIEQEVAIDLFERSIPQAWIMNSFTKNDNRKYN